MRTAAQALLPVEERLIDLDGPGAELDRARHTPRSLTRTGVRPSDPGRGRDTMRVVAALRRDLLAPIDGQVAARHLEAMFLEFEWELAAEPDTCEPVGLRPTHRATKLIGACVAAAALSLTSGFAAAGALPAPAQHWLSRRTRFVVSRCRMPRNTDAHPLPARIGSPRAAPSRTIAPAKVPQGAKVTPKTGAPAGPGNAAGPAPTSRAARQVRTSHATPSWSVPTPSQPTDAVDAGDSTGEGGGSVGDDGAANRAGNRADGSGAAKEETNGETFADNSAAKFRADPKATAKPASADATNTPGNGESKVQSDSIASATDDNRN